MTDTEFNAVKAFLSAYRYTELDLRVRRAELTRLTARKEALILEGNTDLLFLGDRSSVCQLHVLWLNVLIFTSLMIPSLPWTTRLMQPCAVV